MLMFVVENVTKLISQDPASAHTDCREKLHRVCGLRAETIRMQLIMKHMRKSSTGSDRATGPLLTYRKVIE
jgi:hypothetical protein